MARMLRYERGETSNANMNPHGRHSDMSGRKLLIMAIVPMFAVGMTACQVEDEPDFYIEETQVPAQEPIIIEETERDTVEVQETDESGVDETTGY
jgi:hypothetical protein